MERIIDPNEQTEADWQELEELFDLIIKNKLPIRKVFKDIFTKKELEEVANRWKIIKLLNTGKTQADVAEELHVGIVTVTRGSKTLLNPYGGFNQLIQLYDKQRNKNK